MAGSIGQPTQGWLPFMGHKSEVGVATRVLSASYLGMGALQIPDAQNNEIVVPLYLDSGTWKFSLVYVKDPSFGIVTVLWDGVSVGTIDTYAAAGSANNYSEITGISITTPKAADLTLRMATKNASSTGYRSQLNSIALIKTAGAHSTPAGTDTPGTTWTYLPWMGVKGSTGSWGRLQGPSYLGGGLWSTNGAGALNDESNWDIWLEAGTYKLAMLGYKDGAQAIWTLRLDGVSVGTVDHYAASGSPNNYSEITGIAVATAGVKNFQVIALSKNASSVRYDMLIHSVAWIKTA